MWTMLALNVIDVGQLWNDYNLINALISHVSYIFNSFNSTSAQFFCLILVWKLKEK